MDEADRDLTAAAFWYEMHRPGLGHKFLDEIVQALRSIADHPATYPVVWRHTRRVLMNGFPFGIYFRVEHDIVVVVAVMHGSRHPRRWQARS